MSGNSSDVIISDADFLRAASECENYALRLKDVIEKYREIMLCMSMYGIHDKLITDKISGISASVAKYEPLLQEVSIEIKQTVDKYVSEIDSIDKFKY